MIKNINELINNDLYAFSPAEEDFEKIIECYTHSLIQFNFPSNSESLEKIVYKNMVHWVTRALNDEIRIKILVKRLVASVVLKIKVFSDVLVDQCLTLIDKRQLKEILNKLAPLAQNFEGFRVKYSTILTHVSTIVTDASNNQNQTTTSSSQNTPKYWITTKSPEGWRRVIYLDKKKQNGEYSVKIGGAEYTGDHGYDAIPLFDSTQQAIDFVNNVKAGKSSTRRPTSYVSLFNFNIVDITNRKYSQSLYKQNLQDYVLVNTECGDAYINKNASCF